MIDETKLPAFSSSNHFHPGKAGSRAMSRGPLQGVHSSVPPLSGGQIVAVATPKISTGLRAIRERAAKQCMEIAGTSAAAQYRGLNTDAPYIIQIVIVFDARTGVAAKDAHQVPSCPLRQVVSREACEYGRLLPTAPLIFHSCPSPPRLTLRDGL